MDKIKVLIVDDQKLLSDLMEAMLIKDTNISIIGCAKDGCQALELVKQLTPDVVLMDIVMPNCNGIESTKKIKEFDKNIKVLILTTSNNEDDVHQALDNGADGYVLKDITKNELITAINSVHAEMEILHKEIKAYAKFTITNNKENNENDKKIVYVNDIRIELEKRECEIMRMIVDGKNTSEIAKTLFISEGRLRNIITDLISKLMLNDRTQLAVFAIRNNLVK